LLSGLFLCNGNPTISFDFYTYIGYPVVVRRKRVMPIKKLNSDIRILVLTRTADSLYALLTGALREWEYAFSICSTVYEVVNLAGDIPVDEPILLITRPAMLDLEVTAFIEQRFENLQTIGWVDSTENISDLAIARTTAGGMLTVSHLDQLYQVIRKCGKANMQPVLGEDRSKKPDPIEYELSNEEVSALLGVE
jgi:hypothetical protein